MVFIDDDHSLWFNARLYNWLYGIWFLSIFIKDAYVPVALGWHPVLLKGSFGLSVVRMYQLSDAALIKFTWIERRELHRFSADLAKLAIRIADRHGSSGEKWSVLFVFIRDSEKLDIYLQSGTSTFLFNGVWIWQRPHTGESSSSGTSNQVRE